MRIEVQTVDMATMMFPAEVIGKYLPEWGSIPDQFKKSSHPYQKIASSWFFMGVKDIKFTPRDGVDLKKALMHIRACLGSFEPKHEHKIAGVAYLMDEFFSSVKA